MHQLRSRLTRLRRPLTRLQILHPITHLQFVLPLTRPRIALPRGRVEAGVGEDSAFFGLGIGLEAVGLVVGRRVERIGRVPCQAEVLRPRESNVEVHVLPTLGIVGSRAPEGRRGLRAEEVPAETTVREWSTCEAEGSPFWEQISIVFPRRRWGPI